MLLLFLQVTVMTYNLRFDTVNDGVNRWDARKEHVAALIRHERELDFDPANDEADLARLRATLKSNPSTGQTK